MFGHFFNQNFLHAFLGEPKTIEVKAPNGTMYSFTTNTLDNKAFEEYTKQLEVATTANDQQKFDEIWQSLTKPTQPNSLFENGLLGKYEEWLKLAEEVNTLAKGRQSLLHDLFASRKPSNEQIDAKIEQYEEKINKLKSLKENNAKEQEKANLQQEITLLRTKLHFKLTELVDALDDADKSNEINNELKVIHQEIKVLEDKLNNL